MDSILIALATVFNILIVKWKLEQARYQDAAFDLAILFGLASVFANSFSGMVVATITSAIISLYFLKYPPDFLPDLSSKKDTVDSKMNKILEELDCLITPKR